MHALLASKEANVCMKLRGIYKSEPLLKKYFITIFIKPLTQA
jgi:hypothetical protein